jgi:uncharacterized protein YfiM (DUF2279 family)
VKHRIAAAVGLLMLGTPCGAQSVSVSAVRWEMGADAFTLSRAAEFRDHGAISGIWSAMSHFAVPQSPAPDRWFAPDKVRHFFTSALLQSLGYGTLRAMDVEHGSALVGASALTAAFGIGKELSDRRRGYGFSGRDLVWDAAGAAAVSALLARTER